MFEELLLGGLGGMGGQANPNALLMFLLKAQQQDQMMKQRAAMQATDPLRQARVQAAQAKVRPPQSITEILSGKQTTTPTGEGSSMFLYGGGEPVPMEQSNERIRMILDALSAGEAPPGVDPMIGAMTEQAMTPQYAPGVEPIPGQTPFWLQGYEGQIGFNPQTGAFTNIGIEPLPSAKPSQPAEKLARIEQMQQVMTAMDKAGATAEAKNLVLSQVFPEFQEQKRKEKQEEFKQQRQTQADISKQKFLMENQSNFFKRETGEPLIAMGEALDDPDKVLKDYVPLKTENAKDKRQLDLVAKYIGQYQQVLNTLLPQLPSTKEGVVARGVSGANIKYLRAKGNPLVRRMDALRAQITNLAKGFGGDARVSDQEMNRLDAAILGDWETQESGKEALSVLDEFIQARADSLGFPKYKMPGSPTQQPTQKTTEGKGKQLDQATAAQFLNKAGGDKNKARELARAAGYEF